METVALFPPARRVSFYKISSDKMEFNEKRKDSLLSQESRSEDQQDSSNEETRESSQTHYRAMQIYEPWMEPDYYKKKDKKLKIKPAPEPESELLQEPEPVVEPLERPLTVGLSGSRAPNRMLTPVEDIPDEDSTEFVQWVTNGRMDDFGELKKKLFKNKKDWD